MKKHEIKSVIVQMLCEILAGSDLVFKKSEGAFFRRISCGWQRLGVSLYDYNPEFVFSLNLCVRLDPVEEIFNLFSGVEAKHHQTTTTTITRLDHFVSPSEYKVIGAADVAAVGGTLSDVIRNKIIPFFGDHANLIALDKGVNLESPGIDITQNPSGAMHAITLAYLAENPEFDRLVSKHRSNMQLSADANVPFNRLEKYLKSLKL